MSSGTILPTTTTINTLLHKLGDNDPDFRFMSLNDLHQVLINGKPDLLHHDYNTAARTVDHLIKTLDDQNGEVQNLAIKCLAPLVAKLPPQIIGPLLEKLASLKLQNSVDNTVAALALRAVIETLPRPVQGTVPTKEIQEAYSGISRVLIPRMLGHNLASTKMAQPTSIRLAPPSEGILEKDLEINAESVDILIEVVRCFGPMLQPVEIESLQGAIVALLERDRTTSVVKKRAVVAVSILAVYLSDQVLSAFVTRSAQVLSDASASPINRRLYTTIMGSMARSIPTRFDQYIDNVAPLVLNVLGESELQKHLATIEEGTDKDGFNDVSEAALVSLEAFLACCPTQMRPYTDEVLASSLRFLKYDPNYAMDDDEDEQMEDEDDEDGFGGEDDDFDDDFGNDDDDDASWKVRRCAAKVLSTLISTRSSGDLLDNGVLYGQAAPALIKRFDEREENVRLEIIAAMSLLVRKTGEGIIPDFFLESGASQDATQLPMTRKRRRQSSGGGASSLSFTRTSSSISDAALLSPGAEKIPTTGPRADLAEKTPTIVKASVKLLRGKLIPTKQAVVNLLNDIVTVQQGGLAGYFDQLLEPLIEALRSASGSAGHSSTAASASATVSTLRIFSLRLLSHVMKSHSSQHLHPYLSKIVPAVLSAVNDRYYKISSEALQTAEELVKTLTPPRSRVAAGKYTAEIRKLYDALVDRMSSADMDSEVREKAIHALGTLVSRTSTAEGSALLSAEKRRTALTQLLDRLKNETTRLAAVRAIGGIAASIAPDVQVDPKWVRQVVAELVAQLRKANRPLRGSSTQTLRYMTQSAATRPALDNSTATLMVSSLEPCIANNDVYLLAPALRILADLVVEKPKLVVTPKIIAALCGLLQSNAASAVLDQLLQLVTNIGASGVGEPLMSGLLKQVGVKGDPSVVGKVIGNLLVASGTSAGVTIESFISEIRTSREDETRASLALAVLGEAGLRLGADSPIEPDLFLSQFGESFDKVSIAAAVALGRAGAGNVKEYLPVILGRMQGEPSGQYLLLQSIKEFLQQITISQADISAHFATIWKKVLAAATVEDNKVACAECIGRLAIIDPHSAIPQLQKLLQTKDATVRAIAVQALRYTLADSGDAFDFVLKDHLITMLNIMLKDRDMSIRRLAMTVLNSAARNKPELILNYLGPLMPYIIEESKIKPELIREVQMGPFKHLVDDGLEVRKGAYETLYALMETAFSRISIIDLYDRIVDGLGDDNDIRSLSNLMVSKLVYIAPDETARRLDAISEKYRATLSTKLKDTAVKQEHEKQDEANGSVLRVTLLLGEKLKTSLSIGDHPKWVQYWDWVNKDFERQLKGIREESKEASVY